LSRRCVLDTVRLDDSDELINLANLKESLKVLEKEYENLYEVVKRKKEIYEKYKKLTTKSQIEKDLKFFDYMNNFNQLLNLKSQIINTKFNIKKLKNTISKKRIKATGYVNKIYVNKDDYVVPGSLIAEINDLSKQKLIVYVPIDEKIGKYVYINGKKSNFKIYKKWRVTDSNFVTSYKIEIVGNGLKWGEIVRVDFKDK
jgi:ribosomal protein L10